MSAGQPILYYTWLNEKQWHLYIAATADGLCYVSSPDQPLEDLVLWANSRFPGYALVEDREQMLAYTVAITQYLDGAVDTLDKIKHELRGTPFQLAVWEALCRIPYGQTVSYSAVAEMAGRPDAVRAVGAAIGANPVLITIPCHRVIGKNGSLTGYRGGMAMKQQLLQLEQSANHSNDKKEAEQKTVEVNGNAAFV
ncbi:methylated-DNA--[protein]-cysteine S-methyltransferase [Paenibacillus bovis]|uniref:methylated-DNA--[protein]-cysteine S-methyltransferase n=1 Tax=Paenibacillus bovis TaxID=1616788 RepID=A0A172ZEW5_9BACL|nr:methylated-DNA--[protein]-cysteine S-methyltransferase [Paenibacillus bovis]ANF95827.1 cysteine methyltransferase [Paenibacillus bovis]